MHNSHSKNQIRGSPIEAPGTPGWQYAVASSILGWILDAFDFFVVILLIDTLAAHFQVEKSAIVWTISITLAMRPAGAVIFGMLADHFGRRIPLIVCVLYFSIVTLLSAFAPNYALFVLMRALYGIGMGGYWGTGASLAMESAPQRQRGFLSGLMQSGYPIGYLLAAVAVKVVLPRYGWQAMFGVGLPLALLISLMTLKSPESTAWQENRAGSIRSLLLVVWEHRGDFGYLLLLMTVMSCLSHGTQDLYPDFLRSAHGMARNKVSDVAILYNVCAIVGALFFGQISEYLGRRRGIMLALCMSLAVIYPWAFGVSAAILVIGACVMQAGVQGAFAVIPAHLNELSPDATRSLFPGLAYQLGVLLASPTVSIEYALRNRLGYARALSLFEAAVILALLLIFGFGPERTGRSFRRASADK